MPVFFLLLFGIACAGVGIWQHQKSAKRIANKVSDEEIIQIAQENGGIVTTIDLINHTSLTSNEANFKLRQLLNSGVLRYKLTSNFKVVCELNDAVQLGGRASSKKVLKKQHDEISSDGDIIALAVKSKGKLSAAALCMKSDMAIEEAEKRLEFLQEKGVFDIVVNENGTILYHLNDLNLLEE